MERGREKRKRKRNTIHEGSGREGETDGRRSGVRGKERFREREGKREMGRETLISRVGFEIMDRIMVPSQ